MLFVCLGSPAGYVSARVYKSKCGNLAFFSDLGYGNIVGIKGWTSIVVSKDNLKLITRWLSEILFTAVNHRNSLGGAIKFP